MSITVLIEGVNLEKLLRAAQEAGLVLLGVKRLGTRRMRVFVRAADFSALALLCEKSGWEMRETDAGAAVRTVRFFQRRIMLVPAMALCVLLLYLSSQMILHIEIEHAMENGAQVKRILRESGVYPGRMKASISFDEVRAQLAYRLPGLAFAGMRYAGSTLIVDCRAAIQGEQNAIAGSALDIVAAQPGIVTKIWASSGTPQVKPGEAVRKGQVLIKGEERAPKGEMRPALAQGEVYARVFICGEAKAALNERTVVETGSTRTRVTIRTPWHERVVRDAQAFDSQLESREIQPVVGLYLPLWREIETYAETEVFYAPRDKGDAASIAQGAAEEIAKKECPYGALILDKSVHYSMIDNEFVYATVVLEIEAPVAGRIQE